MFKMDNVTDNLEKIVNSTNQHDDYNNFIPQSYQIFIQYLPYIFLWIFTPLEYYYIKKSKFDVIPWNSLNSSKLLVHSICVFVAGANLITATLGLTWIIKSIVFFVLQLISFIFAGILFYCNKSSGVNSSGILLIFWILIFITESSDYYGLITNFVNFQNNDIYENFQTIMTLIQFVTIYFLVSLNLLADNPPMSKIKNTNKLSPEQRCGFVNKLFYHWFDEMVGKGYKKPLTKNDIWNLNAENRSNHLVDKFEKNLHKEDMISVLPAIIKTFGGPFLFAGLFRFIVIILSFTCIQFLGLLIKFSQGNDPNWMGISYAMALFVLSFLIAIFLTEFNHKTSIVSMRIQTALTVTIFKKILKMDKNEENDIGKIINLMAVDGQGITALIPLLHMTWSGLLSILIAIYFLCQELGLASTFVGVFIMAILMIPANKLMASKLVRLQSKQMLKKDERIKKINEILNGIQIIKINSWEYYFEKCVKKIRAEEIKYLRITEFFNGGKYFLGIMTPFLVLLSTFATFVLSDEKNVLDVRKAFISIALFNYIKYPLQLFSTVFSSLVEGHVSLNRINKFLRSDELVRDMLISDTNEYSLSIEDGSFSWSDEKDFFKNLNIKVLNGSLTAIVGKFGSGKSSLIAAFLGEMKKTNGSVTVNGTVAYMPQQSWIQNATIQDNILFGKPMDREFYHKTIEICALIPDIEKLPMGDQTEIGEKGVTLSGGQKQRLSLARAVYSQADIYFFDNPLSALDSNVGASVFNNVLGPNGLLAGKTRIIVTHDVFFLPQVNRILLIKDGQIKDKTVTCSDAQISTTYQNLDRMYSIDETELPNNGNKRIEVLHELNNSDGEDEPFMLKKTIKAEEIREGKINSGVYLRYLQKIGITNVIFILLTNILNQAFSMYSNVWLAQWSSNVNATQPEIRNYYLGIYAALGIPQMVFLLISVVLLALSCLKASHELHSRLLSHLLKLPMNFFNLNLSGRIFNRFSQDINSLDIVLPLQLREWTAAFFTVISIFILLSVPIPLFIVIILILVIIYFFVLRYHLATSRQLKRLESISKSPIYTHFNESFEGRAIILSSKQENRFIEELQSKVDHNQKFSYLFMISNCWLGIRLELIGITIILSISIFCIVYRDSLSSAIVGLLLNYAFLIIQQMNLLVRSSSILESNIVAAERIDEYFDQEQELDEQVLSDNVLLNWPSSGNIEFENYSAQYGNENIVLKNISLVIKSGERIGVVGRTGAAKSTLILSLFRIIETASGKILIDGEDISKIGLHRLRTSLSLVPQDATLFSGSLRMNIDPTSKFSDNEIWTVLEKIKMKDFVEESVEGLDFKVNENGDNLSAGQKQLICLARALLRKTKIVILDEATASIDLKTDQIVQTLIDSEFKNSTIITIAHRINTVLNCDRIILMENGCVIEFDTPANLIRNKESLFYMLAKESKLVD